MAIRKIIQKTFGPYCPDGEVYEYFEGFCNSNDTKPTRLVAEGSKLIETDTGKGWLFNETTGAWAVKFNLSGGGGGEVVNPYDLTVTPTAEAQTHDPTDYGDYNYFSSVTVNGDADLVAGNVKKDVEIFGVTGTFTVIATDENDDGNVVLSGGVATDTGGGDPSVGG